LAKLLVTQGRLAEAAALCGMDAGSSDTAIYSCIAWRLATCVHAQIRDGATAVSFAEKAVAATNRKDATCLDTLAAAYAETRQFAKAVSAEEESIALSPAGQLKEKREARLDLYKSNTPFRESRLEESLFWRSRSQTDSAQDQDKRNPL
jgi:hypothetical protein